MTRLAVFALAAVAGCTPNKPPAAAPVTTAKSEPADHSHERKDMMVADAGPYHALLTAHLSKDGHELDLFFENPADDKPAALPLKSFVADVRVPGGEVKQAEFRPAPADERPAGEGPDRCSHFVAAVPWLDPDAPIQVEIDLKVDGKKVRGNWKNFVPRKYAHHHD